jgi:hypothetical protein
VFSVLTRFVLFYLYISAVFPWSYNFLYSWRLTLKFSICCSSYYFWAILYRSRWLNCCLLLSNWGMSCYRLYVGVFEEGAIEGYSPSFCFIKLLLCSSLSEGKLTLKMKRKAFWRNFLQRSAFSHMSHRDCYRHAAENTVFRIFCWDCSERVYMKKALRERRDIGAWRFMHNYYFYIRLTNYHQMKVKRLKNN